MQYAELSDAQLSDMCVDGDADAFDEVCRRHVRRLYGIAWHLTQSREGAWDATQEALLVAWRNRRSYRGEGSLLGWLRGILVKVCWAQQRKVQRRREVLDPFQGGDERGAIDIPDETANPERVTLQNTERHAVMREFARLPDHYRVPLWLSVHEEMSYAAIAKSLGVPEGTVKSRINMARKILRDRVGR